MSDPISAERLFHFTPDEGLSFPGGHVFGAHFLCPRPGTRRVVIGLYSASFGRNDWISQRIAVVDDFGDLLEVRE